MPCSLVTTFQSNLLLSQLQQGVTLQKKHNTESGNARVTQQPWHIHCTLERRAATHANALICRNLMQTITGQQISTADHNMNHKRKANRRIFENILSKDAKTYTEHHRRRFTRGSDFVTRLVDQTFWASLDFIIIIIII
jgi:hypothetical protein